MSGNLAKASSLAKRVAAFVRNLPASPRLNEITTILSVAIDNVEEVIALHHLCAEMPVLQ